jgi:hypothetical protein
MSRASMRNLAGTVKNALVPPQLQVLRLVGASSAAFVIKAALDLELFPLMAEGPVTAETMGARLEADVPVLRRHLKALVALDLLRQDPAGRFELTELGATLLPDREGSVEPAVRYALSDALLDSLQQLSYSVRTGQASFKHITQLDWYAYGQTNPRHLAIMDRAMRAYSQLHVASMLQAYPLDGYRVLVDVCGGLGHVLSGMLTAYPSLKGILFDLPETITRARAQLDPALAPRCELYAGDVFDRIPEGGDLYLLSKTLNDWGDDHALSILKSIRAAMSSNAKLIIAEMIASDRPSLAEAFRDLTLLAITGGVVRSEADFRSLLTRAGFELRRIVRTVEQFPIAKVIRIPGQYSILECIPASRSV